MERAECGIKADKGKICYLYLYLSLSLDLNLNLYLYPSLSLSLNLDLYLSLDLNLSLSLDLDFSLSLRLKKLIGKLPPSQILLKESLRNLWHQLPKTQDEKAYKQWWQVHGKSWIEKLRQVMITHRNIGYDWQFTEQQKYLLNKYRTANIFLMECLGRAVIDRGVRAEIENTLFLPISD